MRQGGVAEVMQIDELVDAVRDVFEREHVLEGVLRDAPADRARWDRLADVGLFTLLVPAERGGTGLNVAAAAALAMEAGRVLLPEPLSATNLAMAAIGEVTGDVVPTGWLGTHAHAVVAGEPRAFVAITADGDAALHHVDQVELTDRRDPSRPIGTVDLGAETLRATWPLDRSPAWFDAVETVLYAAEAVGALSTVVDRTVAYTCERRQFGQPIGSFQAVKHRCADMWVATELARAAVEAAANAVDEDPDRADVAVAAAAMFVADAFGDVAGASVHLHGGMGYAQESGCHLFVRRALVTRRLLGDRARHRRALLGALTTTAQTTGALR